MYGIFNETINSFYSPHLNQDLFLFEHKFFICEYEANSSVTQTISFFIGTGIDSFLYSNFSELVTNSNYFVNYICFIESWNICNWF